MEKISNNCRFYVLQSVGLKFLYNDFLSHHENNIPIVVLLSVFKGMETYSMLLLTFHHLCFFLNISDRNVMSTVMTTEVTEV